MHNLFIKDFRSFLEKIGRYLGDKPGHIAKVYAFGVFSRWLDIVQGLCIPVQDLTGRKELRYFLGLTQGNVQQLTRLILGEDIDESIVDQVLQRSDVFTLHSGQDELERVYAPRSVVTAISHAGNSDVKDYLDGMEIDVNIDWAMALEDDLTLRTFDLAELVLQAIVQLIVDSPVDAGNLQLSGFCLKRRPTLSVHTSAHQLSLQLVEFLLVDFGFYSPALGSDDVQYRPRTPAILKRVSKLALKMNVLTASKFIFSFRLLKDLCISTICRSRAAWKHGCNSSRSDATRCKARKL